MSRQEYIFDALALRSMFEIVDANGRELIEAINHFRGIPARNEPDTACFAALRIVRQASTTGWQVRIHSSNP
jgi:hypothetical protein